MKTFIRTALIAVAWLCICGTARACDICGCSISNNNPFLFPSASRHFVGLSWYHRSYDLHLEDGSLAHMCSSNLLLTAQYAISDRVRLQAVLPYVTSQYSSVTGIDTRFGIGDINLLGTYHIYNKISGKTKHLLTFTSGIKLNTAAATPSVNPALAVADLQTGSGSTDFIAGMGYRLTRENWTVQLQAGYRYNTQDQKSSLRFGDVTTASVNIYRKLPFSSFTLTPYASYNFESRMDDARAHALVKGSGGTVTTLGAGVDLNTRKLAIGIGCQLPITQTLSNGAIHESLRLNTHIYFTF